MEKVTAITELEDRRRKFSDAMFDILETDPWVPFQFGSQTAVLKLEYSFGAVKALFKDLGKNINVGELSLADLQDPQTLAHVIYRGLQTHQQDMLLEHVESGMRMKMRQYYAYCVQQAIQATQPSLEFIQRVLPDVEEKKEGDEETIELPPLVVTRP